MNPLLELADRVEAAKNGYPALDGAILMALGLDKPYRGTFHAWNMPVTHRIDDGMSMADAIAAGCPEWRAAACYKAPKYTASLDAAMSLVPTGAVYAMSNIDMPNGGTIGPNFMAVVALTLKEEGVPTTAATQPLALTAASLRAIASMGSSG